MLRPVAGTTLTVGPPLLLSLTLSPANPSILPGATQQFTAIGTYTDGSTPDLTTAVTWSSSQPLVGTISNASGAQGQATGVATGLITITATFGSINSSTMLTVGFAATGSLNTPRNSNSATLLPNGKVLIAGGYDYNTGFLASAELYDPATGTYSPTGSMMIPRLGHTATLLNNGKVLFVGGETSSSGYTATAEIYDPATGTFVATGSMSVVHYAHSATLLNNGKVLIAGGYNPANGYLADAQLYDPATGTFTTTGSLVVPHYGHTATLPWPRRSFMIRTPAHSHLQAA